MKIVIDIPEGMYGELLTWNFSTEVAHRSINAITKGRILPKGAEILTAEAYSDLCLRASRIPCYLGSPCEYQNEDIKMLNPHPPVQYVAKINFSEDELEEMVRKALKECETDTCKNVGMDYAEVDQFVCSECGIELQDWHSVERCEDGEVIYHEYTFRFCPSCGRKIVEGAEEE